MAGVHERGVGGLVRLPLLSRPPSQTRRAIKLEHFRFTAALCLCTHTLSIFHSGSELLWCAASGDVIQIQQLSHTAPQPMHHILHALPRETASEVLWPSDINIGKTSRAPGGCLGGSCPRPRTRNCLSNVTHFTLIYPTHHTPPHQQNTAQHTSLHPTHLGCGDVVWHGGAQQLLHVLELTGW